MLINFFYLMIPSWRKNAKFIRIYYKNLPASWAHFHHGARASRSIFCIHFSNFIINYMIKIIYFLSNLSKKKNNRELYLRKRFCGTTLISYLTFFRWKKSYFFNIKNQNIKYTSCPEMSQWEFLDLI